MPASQVATVDRFDIEHNSPALEVQLLQAPPQAVQTSAVSWAAILAGAAAAALSLILLILGTGLGLSSVSPWLREGVSATTFGVSTILWVTFTQIAAAAMGGYLAGRLRIRWIAVQADEVYFRDTAHGFLAWAIASLATAALLTSVIASIIGGGPPAVRDRAMAGTAAVTGAALARADRDGGPIGYFVDALFRSDGNGVTPTAFPAGRDALSAAGAEQTTTEVTRIFFNVMPTGTLPEEDLRYVGQVVAQRTGLTQADAEQRVTQTLLRLQARQDTAATAAKEAANAARKAAASASLWLFISLLSGAFVASFAAIYGGRQRDC
ncbi:hypothetical protein [uncultured Thiodictyon sp.]|uniref:hypothetical protein n=1 Tax=uncultured Thiodictyon sp. TaxID=1846217 RepID=UPI0025F06B67|nr:hypothetical protein [uncultured Thiodictyon sp.]